MQAIVVFKIDAEEWTLDLRQDREGDEGPRLLKGPPSSYTADVTMTCTDANFVALCMGKLKPQQVMPGFHGRANMGQSEVRGGTMS